MKNIIHFFILTILFICWSEYSVGSILFRPDSSGNISFNIKSMLSFMINPFYKKDLWNLNTLDINYPFIIGYSFFIHSLF